jgi:3-hydroxymyristoyl/3-hydroxydecanoyl-(acyl carrier protein) dehydratase
MTDHFARIVENANRTSQIHGHFMDLRHSSLKQIEKLVELQLSANLSGENLLQPKNRTQAGILFGPKQLMEFAKGDLVNCFGPELEIYRGRRFPRIPNDDLAMISRVMQIQGEKHLFNNPASILSEYDVPLEAWYLEGNPSKQIPYSLLMEIALQPCGFLSAYLGTPLLKPEMDFIFRNLDGQAKLLDQIDLRGKTISTKANLLSTLLSGDTILQKFDFSLECNGLKFFAGQSTFGYFSPQAMAKQAGLDGGKKTQPTFQLPRSLLLERKTATTREPENPMVVDRRQSEVKNSSDYGRFPGLVENLTFSAIGGKGGKGSIYASRKINPDDWFFKYHFFKDPVMPGSLGMEAVIQALQGGIAKLDRIRDWKMVSFDMVEEKTIQWQYRGQILPENSKMQLEAEITQIEQRGNQVWIEADANLWSDDIRIYRFKGICIRMYERV